MRRYMRPIIHKIKNCYDHIYIKYVSLYFRHDFQIPEKRIACQGLFMGITWEPHFSKSLIELPEAPFFIVRYHYVARARSMWFGVSSPATRVMTNDHNKDDFTDTGWFTWNNHVRILFLRVT